MSIYLPEEIKIIIYKFFFSMYVLKEIKEQKSIWKNPSINLLYNSSDIGALQHNHSDLEKLLLNTNSRWVQLQYEVFYKCFYNLCNKCIIEGFPCSDATHLGCLHKNLENFWDMSFYKNQQQNDDIINIEDDYI